MNEYKYNPINMTPFKWFVLENFPFIEEDFDSLTSYGLWCKLKKYFDNVATKVNEMGLQVQSLTEAFTALKDYVDNYFENLDVQDEINNKLDEMVEDGTLTNILMNYANVERIYNTTVEMIADSSHLHNNQKIKTLGYYNRNDGGGAEFLITNTEDTNEFQITVGNLYATLIVRNYVNPIQMGVQDNVATNLLTKASQIAQNHKVPIRLSKITYLITESIPLFNNCEIDGHNAIIKSELDIPLLYSGNPVSYLNIHDLRLVCSNNSEHNNANGIEVPCYYSKFKNISISYGYTSINITTNNATGTLVENYYADIICRSPRHAGIYLGNLDNNKITDGFLNNIIVNGSTSCDYGVYIGSAAGYNINGAHFYGNINTPLVIANAYYTNVNNIYIEKANSRSISCPRVQTALNISNVVIKQTNDENDCIRCERSSYHPTNNSDVNISNITIIRPEEYTSNVINCISLYAKVSNVNLNAVGQNIEDFCNNCIFSVIGTISNNNISVKNNQNTVLGNTRIHHRTSITNQNQLIIDIPNVSRWNQRLLSLKCFGAVYQNQTGKYYSADFYFFANDSTAIIRKFNEVNSMFEEITATFDVENKQIIIDFTFNANNIYAIADYTVDI